MKHVSTGKVFLLAEHLPGAAARRRAEGAKKRFLAKADSPGMGHEDEAAEDVSYTTDPSESGVYTLGVHRRTQPSGPQ